MRNISEKNLQGIIFSSENPAVYEIMWENIVAPGRPQIPIEYDAEKMRFPCRITEARLQKHSRNIYYLMLLREVRNIR